MRKTQLLWFLVLLIILRYSPCASKSNAEHGDFKTSKSKILLNYMYGMTMGSNKTGNQRTIPSLHVVQHEIVSRKPINGGSNDLRPPNKGRKSSNSVSIKPSSLFMAALSNLSLGSLLFLCFY